MNAMTTSPLAAARELANKIDPAVETLLDAHEFGLTQLLCTPSGARAQFRRAGDAQSSDWLLALSLQPDGTAEIQLTEGTTDTSRLLLCIRLGNDGAVPLNKAIGLAVSFLGFAQQLGLGSA